MTASLPRLRPDLAFCRQVTASGEVFVVKHPIRGEFYRFGAAERFITQLLDGATPMDDVRQRAEKHFGAALELETLNGFLKRLDRAGLLAAEDEVETAPTARRLKGSLLYLRFKLFDPNQLFDRLIGQVKFFFTPFFLALSAISILAAIWVAFVGWEEVAQNLSRVYRVSAIPVVIAIAFLVIGAHEFAHGLTCKYFGGEVREIGFFLVYFQPALYCNVSDAWLFSEKSKRLWVSFAGPYFELFLWSLATFVWRMTEVETWINYVAFIIMTTSGIKTLFNFNPLIKLDGYYLLSDWLEIPNLRRRAFSYVGDLIRHPFGGGTLGTQMLPRERRICLVYGLWATIGSFAILGYAFIKFGTYLSEQRQPLALALVSFLLVTKVQRRFRRLFGKSTRDDDDDDDADQPEARHTAATATPATPATPPATAASPKTAEPATPPEPRQPKQPKQFPRWLKRVLVGGLSAGALMVVLVLGHAELRIGGPFDALPIQNADVRAEVEGIVDEICVQEGGFVAQGGVVARLSDRDHRAELRKIAAESDEARARLKLLEAGSRAEEIELARTTIGKNEERVKFGKSRLGRDQLLFDQKLISAKELEDSEAYLADRQNEVAEAAGRLDLLRAGSRPEAIEEVKAEITRLEAQRFYIDEQRQLLTVVSPCEGIVATPARQLMEMRHQLIKKGDLIAKVFDLKTITAEIIISEREIADIQLGQKVMLKVRAFPDRTFIGKVTSIATSAQINSTSTSANQPVAPTTTAIRNTVAPKTVLVTSEIENSSLLLKPEMTGQAKIFCGQRRLIDLVTRRIVRTLKVQFWSWL